MRTTAFFFPLAMRTFVFGADDPQTSRVLLAACMRYASEDQLDKRAECWYAEATSNGSTFPDAQRMSASGRTPPLPPGGSGPS